MSSQKFKTNSFCVGHKSYSATKNIAGEITFIKKTVGEIKFLVGQCVSCNRKNSMFVSDNAVEAEGLGCFFQKSGNNIC